MATLARLRAEAFLGLHRNLIVSTSGCSLRPPRPQHSRGRPAAATATAATSLQLLGKEGVLPHARGTEGCR